MQEKKNLCRRMSKRRTCFHHGAQPCRPCHPESCNEPEIGFMLMSTLGKILLWIPALIQTGKVVEEPVPASKIAVTEESACKAKFSILNILTCVQNLDIGIQVPDFNDVWVLILVLNDFRKLKPVPLIWKFKFLLGRDFRPAKKLGRFGRKESP